MSKRKEGQLVGSDDYIESLQAVAADPYDNSSWSTVIDELEAGRGGNGDYEELMGKFLASFPCAGKEWIRLVEYMENKGKDVEKAEATLSKVVKRLRSVDVWRKYIDLVRRASVNKHGESGVEAQGHVRVAVEEAYEKAADNVGMSVNSGALWKDYIEFVKAWPDASGMDPGKKLAAARKVYQRSLIVPMDALDYMYTGYEQFERAEGEHSAREYLPEWEKKYLSSKALLNDRKTITNRVSMTRLATPPTKSLVEMSQLSAWNKWIRYERGNPSNLDANELLSMMKMIYEMCLCCFRHHAEVWLSYANYLSSNDDGSMEEAKGVLREAVDTIPSVTILRFALAEMEELSGSVEGARSVLMAAYEQHPSGLSFGIFQRFVRRHDGFIAARKLFSDTQHLRQEKRVGFDIYMVNAQLELEGNCDPVVASKVLSLCRAAYPAESVSVAFVRLMVRTLVRQNDLRQIQWELNVALARAGGDDPGVFALGDTALPNVGAAEDEEGKRSESRRLSLQDQLDLWNDYLSIETTLGLSSLQRLNELREHRDLALKAVHEMRMKQALGQDGVGAGTTNIAGEKRAEFKGLYEMVPLLGERYTSVVHALPQADLELQKRCNGRGRQVRGKGDSFGMGGSDDLPLPPALQSFLSRLPPHTGQEPDIDQFLRRFKNLVLPPRPIAETETDNDLLLVGSKRGAPGDWLNAGGADEGDGIDYEEDDLHTSRDDVFRQRQRARLQ